MHKLRSKISPKSWIDDLPVCKKSGIGFSSNQIYREDGNRHEEHPFEDRSFHCRSSNDPHAFLYGVFDGFNGIKAVEFCLQKLPADILFAQLHPSIQESEIKRILSQAFLAVENGYMEVLDTLLAQRMSFDIPYGVNPYEFFKGEELAHLEKINCDISCGATVAIALIYNDILYTANVGNCRILLCETDGYSLKVRQLSVDHDTSNEDELLRLSEIKVKVKKLPKEKSFGHQDVTRCIGNYSVKGGYKENPFYREAIREPVIAEPEVIDGIKLSDSHKFLLLMSSGFCKAVMEAKGLEDMNKFVASCVVEEFKTQTTLTGVAQAVVDKVVRLHHDWYWSQSQPSGEKTREDISLVVRNFNYPMPNSLQGAHSLSSSPMNSSPNTIVNSSMINNALSKATSIVTTETSTNNGQQVPSEPQRTISAYVDFQDFYDALERAKKNGPVPSELG